MNLIKKDIHNKIVESIKRNVESKVENELKQTPKPIKLKVITPTESSQFVKQSEGHGENGVFEDVQLAIDAAYEAQIKLISNYQIKDRNNFIEAIRNLVQKKKRALAKLVLEETKLGNLEDKVSKLELTIDKTPGTEDLKTGAFSGDGGVTLVNESPFGLIGAVTPVTNPVETIINNTISMVAAGNGVIFNVHPSSARSSAYVVGLINQAIIEAGGPSNLITMVKKPTLDTLEIIKNSSKVKLLVGTGGPGMVKALLQSGKKVIGAGAGNPPVLVDDTADLKLAAKAIIEGASFDNNLLCISEKEVFVLDSVADDLIFELLNEGAYMLNRKQLQHVMDFALEENTAGNPAGCSYKKRNYLISKDWVGKDVALFLENLQINQLGAKLLICDVDFTHPFVQLEQLMPILPIVRVNDLDEAIEKAVAAEQGNRHTAVMHSKNIDHITTFAKAIQTTLFITNASSLAGVGFGGEGHTTMTIAGPTGEGVTSARTFTRQQRIVEVNDRKKQKGL